MWLILSIDSDTGFEKSSSGRWAEDEHERFLEAYIMFGNDWKKVSTFVKTRSIPQVGLERICLLVASDCIGSESCPKILRSEWQTTKFTKELLLFRHA